MAELPNEFFIEHYSRPGMPLIYRIRYGKEVIGELASFPSADDCRMALERYRSVPTESERLKQLREKSYRHGQFPRGDDESARDG